MQFDGDPLNQKCQASSEEQNAVILALGGCVCLEIEDGTFCEIRFFFWRSWQTSDCEVNVSKEKSQAWQIFSSSEAAPVSRSRIACASEIMFVWTHVLQTTAEGNIF